MAYRFLLEVPDALYEQANVVITAAPDADIVDVHEGIGGDFDNPGKTVTLVAYSLDIVYRLDAWYRDVERAGEDTAPVNYLLTDGRRLPVAAAEVGDTIAGIRRDQPWVERTIPKIGDHTTRSGPASALTTPVATLEAREAGVAIANAPTFANVTILATDDPAEHRTITIDDVLMLHLEMIDLDRPEHMYAEVLGAKVVGRANRDGKGGWTWLDAGYDTEQEAQFGTEPDFAFLQNGALTVALERMGRAYPLPVFAHVPQPIRLLVDDASFERIKAEVLVRNWNVYDLSTPGVFGFRDPFGYTWSVHHESTGKDA